MEFALISSSKDTASLNIKESLLKSFKKSDEVFEGENVYFYKNAKIYTTNKELIYSEDIDKEIKADFFIFLSKHKSKSEIPSLTVHPIGNWDKAELGGKNKTLVYSSAKLVKEVLITMYRFNNLDFEVTLESDHHGPYLEKPSFFIEIGSTENEWKNKKAGEIIAKTIYEILDYKTKKYRIAIGIGGQHYPYSFNKITLGSDIAIGHICPKHYLYNFDEDLLKQMIEKTEEKVDFIILDWKGLGQFKQKVSSLVKKFGLSYVKTRDIAKQL